MGFGRKTPVLISERLELRLPRRADYIPWVTTRRDGIKFLQKWEPIRARDYDSRSSFYNGITGAKRQAKTKTAFSFMIIRRADATLIGAITLNNVRFGPSRTGTLGYWIGPDFARQGYMSEALELVTDFAYRQLDLSRIEAACLPENEALRRAICK